MSSEELIKDILIHKQEHFSDRLTSLRAQILLGDGDIILANDTPKRYYKKNQVKRVINQHWDGLENLKEMTVNCGKELIAAMEAHALNAFDPFELIRLAAASNIMALTYGYSTPEDAQKIVDIEKRLLWLIQPCGLYLLLDICPPLRYISPQMKLIYNELHVIRNEITEMCRAFTNARKKAMKNPDPKIFIDHFLNLAQDKTQDLDKQLDENDIIFIGMDLLLGGVATTSMFLYSLLGILVNHPSVQDKGFAEIMDVIGQGDPRFEDRQRMPYIESIILETLRYASFIPIAIPHYSRYDSELGGYFIPKGTMIIPHLWNINHDNKHWDEPWLFRPERFIEDGKLVTPDHIKRQRLLPFGGGRRRCAGETFARNRLFILVVQLLQRYKFLPAQGHPRPRHDPREYFRRSSSIMIKPFLLSVQER